MNTKVCSKCKRELPADKNHFRGDKYLKDGLSYVCKECVGYRFTEDKPRPKEGYKFCTKCKRELPLTLEYFYRDKTCLYGLSAYCKECRGHEFGMVNAVRENGHRVCSECRRNLPETDEFFHKSSKKHYYSKCRECLSKIATERYYKNHEKVLEYHRDWHQQNYQRISDKIKARVKEYRKKVKGTEKFKHMNKRKSQRRRAKLSNLPITLTLKQWQYCKEYFNNQCAYCGKEKKQLEQEHVIPVVRGGGYTKENIIPACRKCNPSKADKDFSDWYPKQPFYSPEREQKILTYLKEMSQQEMQTTA